MSDALATHFRELATSMSGAAEMLRTAAGYGSDPTVVALVIIGQVNANTYNALADVVEHLTSSDKANHEQPDRVTTESNAIRLAAANGFANGDWSKFDELVQGNINGEFLGEPVGESTKEPTSNSGEGSAGSVTA